jgi:hypothetical protein
LRLHLRQRLFATSASATVYHVDIKANPGFVGEIVGDITVVGTTVTAFTGTASGFGFGGIFDGPTTLGQSGGGPAFVGDNQWAGAPYYVSQGDRGSGGGWLLTNGTYNYRLYDYTDAFNNYGDQLAWFGASGYNPATIDLTISITEATPLPAAWSMMLIGFAGYGAVRYRAKSKAFASA